MIGVLSGLSFEFLGITILAWSNSFGDIFADLSVVKQGFPRMAMAAATGGPLFSEFDHDLLSYQKIAVSLDVMNLSGSVCNR